MIIDKSVLDALVHEASASPRRRRNLNFHSDEHARCNRLLNAIEPDSYIQPHCHLDPDKDETVILLRGKLGVIFFSEYGDIVMKHVLDPARCAYGINIPFGTIHTMLSFESGTVFFESKAGPYVPVLDAERASWAPKEGDAGVVPYLESLRMLFGF